MAALPGMLFELAAYGLITGVMMYFLRTGKPLVDIYISLLTAMLCGRFLYGILNAVIFRAGDYSLEVWLTAAFVTGLPGIIIQLVFVPAIVFTLEKRVFAKALFV